ncbi:glycoside hydrolase family 3 N-terminal domain-containing protein [Chryseolinea lacunae]|uniref:beta-N-acetylhexosaminidase n=1 Tax=Chryseolinea lacunae TaxID=2801331 RepID=A0ABS1KTG4_9BACT|nr:glycoside hydrolase family 3 N-terminal domain-containing protein [Chryseolinea lacunae]MBL0742468.1 serine hydrolase [Chryseolinea lacunae]
MVKKVFLSFLFLGCGLAVAHAQTRKNHWVDSVFHALTVEEKIGQLFMVTVPPNANKDELHAVNDAIENHDVGGVIFQYETPTHQAQATNSFQAASRIPLFIGQDAEWGLGQSVDSTLSLPRPLVLGAIKNDSMVYLAGREVARQMKVLGVNLNFGPTADVSSNPQDPLVSYRSFGEDKVNVAAKATAFMRGLQDHGVLACAKHFTVKGLTVLDVKNDIPTIKPTLDSVKAYPYIKLFESNLAGVMPAASTFPLFYESKNLARKNNFDASTLSLFFTGEWLKGKLNFNGLVFVDLHQVKTVTEKIRTGEAEMFAFQAGNDILIGSEQIGPAIRKIKKLVKGNDAYESQLDKTVKKILAFKYDAGLAKRKPVIADNLVARLNGSSAKLMNQKLYEAAITVVNNTNQVLPLKVVDNKHFAYISSQAEEPNKEFFNVLSKYANASYFTLDEKSDLMELSDGLHDQEVIVVGIFPQTTTAVIDRLTQLLKLLTPAREVIYCDFGNESFLKTAGNYPTVITAYANTPETLRAVPQIIFGALPAQGHLPFTAAPQLRSGQGHTFASLKRLSYSIPEDAGMDGRLLPKIDSIVSEAIRMNATPGCQVLVARHGKVIYDKNFGALTYDKTSPVSSETIYDLASLTKVSATLQAVMFMYEHGKIDLHKKISFYLPELKNTNKKDITLLEILTHQAGLTPFVPMWNETVKDTTFLPLYYSRKRDAHYPLQVSGNLYAAPNIRDSVWSWIAKSKLVERPARTPFAYKYSDLGFLMLQRLAERLLNQPLDEFLHQNLYEPLGAYTTGYLPLSRFPLQSIAPTEDDKIYRKTRIAGTVHDERAAMMGGVAGHAGLFSNATDLAKLGQMLLQEGEYGGLRYYRKSTVQTFTAKQFDKSRRGLGWDKPVQSDWNSPTSLKASPKTFGHTGFTGTCMWVDPEFDLVYIFLSNRVYPDRSNKLNNANIRSRIQDVVYDAIFAYCGEAPDDDKEPEQDVMSSRR